MGVFSNLKQKGSAPRNAFDLSRYSSFSSKLGLITPVFHQLTLPNGEYSLDVKQLLRTQPLQKAAFTGFSINYDVIWCPLNHLYSSFNQFIAQRSNKNLVVQPTYQVIPKFNLRLFVSELLPYALYDYFMTAYSYDVRRYFHYTVSESKMLPDYMFYSEHGKSSLALSALRALDMLDYGNYLPVIKNLFSFISKVENISDYSSFYHFLSDTVLCIDQSGNFDPQTFHQYIYTGYLDNPLTLFYLSRVFIELDVPEMPTLWPALAYNKSFYEFYRNSYYDTQFTYYYVNDYGQVVQSSFDYVQLFNLDDYVEGTAISFNRLLCIFGLKPHLYKRDLFTGVLPDTQFGDVSVMSETDIWHKILSQDSVDNVNEVVAGTGGASSPLQGLLMDTSTVTGSRQFKLDPSAAISILEFRRADSMQRFKERMMRAGDKTKDIFVAHGWDKPKSELTMEPLFLGSFDGRLDINTVASTASTEGADLGQLAANGVGVVSGQKIKIRTSDFGVLLVLFHVDKDAVYNSFGLSAQHMLTEPFDFPYPVLQNISLSPIDRRQLSRYSNRQSSDAAYSDTLIVGYLPRFMQFKTAIDEVHGEFYSHNPMNRFGSDTDLQAYLEILPSSGAFSDWTSVRVDEDDVSKLSFLYIHPSDADGIFVVQDNDRQSTDPFLVNARFDCYAVQPLSVIGLPQ